MIKIQLQSVSCSATNYTRCWEQTASGVESRMCGTVPRACERARACSAALLTGCLERRSAPAASLLGTPANFFCTKMFHETL